MRAQITATTSALALTLALLVANPATSYADSPKADAAALPAHLFADGSTVGVRGLTKDEASEVNAFGYRRDAYNYGRDLSRKGAQMQRDAMLNRHFNNRYGSAAAAGLIGGIGTAVRVGGWAVSGAARVSCGLRRC